MGSFRSQPDLNKHSLTKNGTGNISYSVTNMCGWRIYMEDAHITLSPTPNNPKNSIFGVFDGHGGAEVSTYVERHFVKELEANKNYQAGKYEDALRETFLYMD
jgi:serine/threonine protein phosphatase PrpC